MDSLYKPSNALVRVKAKDVRRILSRMNTWRQPKGCWIWQGAPNSKGYGVVWINGRNELVHRAMFVAHHGPLAAGETVDHVCRTQLCGNPQHLQKMTEADNRDQGNRDRGLGHETFECPGCHGCMVQRNGVEALHLLCLNCGTKQSPEESDRIISMQTADDDGIPF